MLSWFKLSCLQKKGYHFFGTLFKFPKQNRDHRKQSIRIDDTGYNLFCLTRPDISIGTVEKADPTQVSEKFLN